MPKKLSQPKSNSETNDVSSLEAVDYQSGGLDQAKQKGNYCKLKLPKFTK